MRTRCLLAVIAVIAVVVLAGCGGGDGVPLSSGATMRHPVFVRTGSGLSGVDPDAGVIVDAPGAIAAPGWSTLAQTGPVDGQGLPLSTIDTRTGRGWTGHIDVGASPDTRTGRGWTGHIDVGASTATLAPRAVATDGGRVALVTAATGQPSAPGYPAGRDTTTLVVAGPAAPEARTYELPGNFEPEAFSLDGAALFVIEYSPATAPDRYRVRTLDLASGAIDDVVSPDADLQQDMRGTPSMQVPAPDGTRVYTLYSRIDPDGQVRAFVHVLDLAGRWAHCVDLPDAFARVGSTMAVSPDGRRLAVVDHNGDVAEVDTARLRVVRTGSLSTSAMGPVALGDDGRVYVIDVAGRVLVAPRVGAPAIAVGEGNGDGTWGASDVALTQDGRRLVVVAGGKMRVVDAIHGTLVREVDAVVNAQSLRWPSPLLDTGGGRVECAC